MQGEILLVGLRAEEGGRLQRQVDAGGCGLSAVPVDMPMYQAAAAMARGSSAS